ncbi:NAD(P)H-binding protein [Sutterella sp.]|uniref:NAD(P)H-binding protein n=1 Tax=Sutterella sp. TaxID=1981025 RepID=UPI0026E0182C|nr:NAD(P)H-binding protein [Sutterella sp.]MDO5531662.1 NAD(P)H-binding protein [Sutterella sp.]
MKRYLIIGASGGTGRVITRRLLADTDALLTLVARRADRVLTETPRTRVIAGDASDPAFVARVLPGHDAVLSLVSGPELPKVAANLVRAMEAGSGTKRLVLTAAVGIYNEIPDDIDGEDNLEHEPLQRPNREAADIVEASALNWTVLRPGYLRDGDEHDFVFTQKGEPARGYVTTLPSFARLVRDVLADETLMSRRSVSITRDARAGG